MKTIKEFLNEMTRTLKDVPIYNKAKSVKLKPSTVKKLKSGIKRSNEVNSFMTKSAWYMVLDSAQEEIAKEKSLKTDEKEWSIYNINDEFLLVHNPDTFTKWHIVV